MKQLTDESIQRIKKNLPPNELAVFQLFLSEYHSRSSQVEEMQKALERICFDSEKAEFESLNGANNFRNYIYEIANDTLQSLKEDKPQ